MVVISMGSQDIGVSSKLINNYETKTFTLLDASAV
ncbi:hypothetical protein SAMN06265350_10770 [Solitalea koreensis]|uniref:Uncharacterized protein n=1 Tax=Solitalea koreensis TaxID=543615 RepID=A0A521DKA6_9SPHI|nr:hypothetical protein SAMN06265350_10770 [Solitalea koreensis]